MVQEKEYFAFRSYQRKSRLAMNSWSCSNAVPFGVPLVLLWLSSGALKWIRGAFEEGSKVMWRYTLLMDINVLVYEADYAAKNICSRGDERMWSNKCQQTWRHERELSFWRVVIM